MNVNVNLVENTTVSGVTAIFKGGKIKLDKLRENSKDGGQGGNARHNLNHYPHEQLESMTGSPEQPSQNNAINLTTNFLANKP